MSSISKQVERLRYVLSGLKQRKMIRKPRSVAPSPKGFGNETANSEETVVPITIPRKIHAKREERLFRIIFTLALLIGLSLPPFMIHSRWVVKVLKAWCNAVFWIRTIFMIMVCVYNFLFWPSLALRYSYFNHCLIGYAVMILFLVKGREIAASTENLMNVSSKFYSNETHKGSLVEIYMLACFLCFTVFYALGAYFFFYVFWIDYIEKLTALTSFREDSVFFYYYNWMVLFGVLASYHISSATLYVTSFLCVLSYRMLGDFFHLFGRKLRNDASRQPLIAYTVCQNVGRFKDIFYSIGTTDRALNMAAFAVYVAVINGAYIVLSLILSYESKFRTIEVELIWVMISIASVLKFIFLTLSGDYIARQSELLNYDLIAISDIVLNKSPIISVHMFSLLCANIRTLKVHVTGFGYFEITRKIIPSAVGVMITYGTWIHQVGAYTDL